MDDREINGSVTGVEGMFLRKTMKIMHLRYEPNCPMIYMANGAANAELLRSIWCLSTHEEAESSSAHDMPSGWVGGMSLLDIYSHYLIDSVAQWFRAPAYIVRGCWFNSSPCRFLFPRSPRIGFQQSYGWRYLYMYFVEERR